MKRSQSVMFKTRMSWCCLSLHSLIAESSPIAPSHGGQPKVLRHEEQHKIEKEQNGKKKRKPHKVSDSTHDIANATGSTCYEQQEVESLESWYHLDNIDVWAGAHPTDWECPDGAGFLSPWYPRCERPADDGLAGSLLSTGLVGMEWQQLEQLETYWSECLDITSWPLFFDEGQSEWLESESAPQETKMAWAEQVDLTFFPNGPDDQMDGFKSIWTQALFCNQFEWPGLKGWSVEVQEQDAQRSMDVVSPKDAEVPWPERLGLACCRCDQHNLLLHHLGEPPWSL